MGIKDLSKVIADHAPDAVRTNEMKAYFGRSIAIDASMSMYQFLIAVRQDGAQLADSEGNATSHLNGMFYRTIRMMENGIKPVFVFDGKPPVLKANELDKRTERRADNEKQLAEAREKGDSEAMEKFERRLVKVTPQHNEECKHLLRLMGLPVIEAPCEAEAQCAELVRTEKVYATATEDMDALTFGSNILVRQMTFSESKKMPVKEFTLKRIYKDLDMTREMFIDLCILLGCDYCPTIRGIGPKRAYELIAQHKNIETILENIDHKKLPPPDNWLYAEARNLFLNPEVTKGEEIELVWKEPDVDGIISYMVESKGFSEERIRTALARLQKGREKQSQVRIDSFFKTVGTTTTEPSAQKRKLEEDKAKKARGAGGKKTKKGTPKNTPKREK